LRKIRRAETYQNLAYNLAATLKRLSKSLESHEKYVADNALFDNLEKLEAVIAEFGEKYGDAAHESVMMSQYAPLRRKTNRENPCG
jgi:hypothetical protein